MKLKFKFIFVDRVVDVIRGDKEIVLWHTRSSFPYTLFKVDDHSIYGVLLRQQYSMCKRRTKPGEPRGPSTSRLTTTQARETPHSYPKP